MELTYLFNLKFNKFLELIILLYNFLYVIFIKLSIFLYLLILFCYILLYFLPRGKVIKYFNNNYLTYKTKTVIRIRITYRISRIEITNSCISTIISIATKNKFIQFSYLITWFIMFSHFFKFLQGMQTPPLLYFIIFLYYLIEKIERKPK